jgi:hypothetical protein
VSAGAIFCIAAALHAGCGAGAATDGVTGAAIANPNGKSQAAIHRPNVMPASPRFFAGRLSGHGLAAKVKHAITSNLRNGADVYSVSNSTRCRRLLMSPQQFLAVVIVLVLAAVFLFIWVRRDRGVVPEDHLPEALHEPLDGRLARSR